MTESPISKQVQKTSTFGLNPRQRNEKKRKRQRKQNNLFLTANPKSNSNPYKAHHCTSAATLHLQYKYYSTLAATFTKQFSKCAVMCCKCAVNVLQMCCKCAANVLQMLSIVKQLFWNFNVHFTSW